MRISRLSLEQAREVYHTCLEKDFPRNERKPFATIERALRKGKYICYGAYDGDKLQGSMADICGYAFFVVSGEDYLFDYFAVRKDLRDQGYGSAFLKKLSEVDELRSASCVLLEIENPRLARGKEKDTCERREQFYLKNGLVDPNVACRTFGVDYKILELPVNGTHSREKVIRIYQKLYRSYLPEPIFRAMVRMSRKENQDDPCNVECRET